MQKFKSPRIPKWIRDLSHPDYRNIFSYGLGNTHLWGTETFLGDWDGQFLLLAKDFYPASYIDSHIRAGDKNPYRHDPKIPTNRNLRKILQHFGKHDDTTPNTDCGFLFASVCFLLRDDGLVRAPLPDARKVLGLSAPVIQFTIEKMPNLKHVILMGNDARMAFRITDFGKDFSRRKIRVSDVSHPSARMPDVDRYAEWRRVFR